MFSHIVSLMNHYEHDHGARPNVVIMNETNYCHLREELAGVQRHEDVIAILGVDIALSDSVLQPQVATARFASENLLVS